MKKKISTYAKEHNLTYQTVYKMVKRGEIPSVTLPTNTILIVEGNIDKPMSNALRVFLYARVSSSENKDNLERQMERIRSFAIAKGYTIIGEVSEIGSGLNDNRKKLEKILLADNYDCIIVEHKDRLARFGVHYLECLLEKQGKKIEVINEVPSNSKEDLLQDFVSIITSFTARLYGLRRSRRKTEKIIKELSHEED